jgi:FtsH-binding integral membrane protein
MKTQQNTGFCWNFWGLLGSALGCSAWMVLMPFIAGWHVTGIASALVCVIVILAAVPILWRMKENIKALQGMYIFLAIAFLATCSFLLIAHFMRLPMLVSWPPPASIEASKCFWILLLFPALALLFCIVDKSNKIKS